MPRADLWLQQLATYKGEASAREQTIAAAVRELWEELQRCAAVFNFHRGTGRNIKVFLRDDDSADVILASATARLSYREAQLRLQLLTVATFTEQEQQLSKFTAAFSAMGLLHWQQSDGQRFSTEMLVRHIFEHLLQYTS